jgi:hypothetical protein
VSADVIGLTLLFFGLIVLVVWCYRNGWIELGVAAAATVPWFIYRVVQWDANRLIEDSERSYLDVRPRRRIQPVTVEAHGGGWTVRYGQLDATQDQYRDFLRHIQAHPKHRLTRDAVPNGMMTNITEHYPGLVKELRRLEWVDHNLIFTAAGLRALEALTRGHETQGAG